MLVKQEWIHKKHIPLYRGSIETAYFDTYLCTGYFLFGFIPLYIYKKFIKRV